MYTKFGYTVYRRVLDYYTGEHDEDAFGIIHVKEFLSYIKDFKSFLFSRYAQSNVKGRGKKSVIPLPHPVTADELDP